MAAMARAREGLETYSVFDFRKGLDLKMNPLTLALSRGQNSLVRASNVLYSRSGAVSRRPGGLAIDGYTGNTGTITGGTEFVRSNGASTIVLGTDAGAVYALKPDLTATAIITGLTTGTSWYFAQYNDKLFICNRADTPRYYDGTTVTTLSGTYLPAKGGPVAVHGNRVFMLDATAGLRSTVAFCKLNAETDWTTASDAGSFVVSNNDGSDCLNLVPSIEELIIIKGSRPFRLQGTNPSVFAVTALVPTVGSVGSVSHQGAIFANNDVWYLSRAGIVSLKTVFQFGDLRSAFASDRISPYFEPATAYTLPISQLDTAVMTYDESTNWIYVGVDTDGDRLNDTMLVYDITLGAWSVLSGKTSGRALPTAIWPVRTTASGLVDIYAGERNPTQANGFLVVLNRDTTRSVVAGARHLSSLGAPGVEKSLRYFFGYFGEKGSHTVTLNLRYDGAVQASKTYTISMQGASKLLGSTWTLGTDPLGAAPSIAKRVDVSGLAEFVDVEITSTAAALGKAWEWQGYVMMWRRRRTVRRGA